ncbi:sigma-E factor negative regulatory protein [Dokdonella sp.]|uniref:sigma-E factor negative regulatory protein n=1 Tax=Dokdonella sp. TaxID=2291710 RepID=UPI0037840571
MNEQIDEQLSALVDGELERDQTRFLLRRVAADPALPLRWERYQVARQALRRQQTFVLRPGFAAAVMEQLAQEPALRARGGQWLRWGAGGAIAASVAVAALVLTRPAEVPTAVATRSPLAAPSITIAAAPASATTTVTPAPVEIRPPLLLPNAPLDASPASFGTEIGSTAVLDPRLQSYVVRHYQAVGGNGQSGFMPYVLLTAPQRPVETAHAGSAAPRNR